VTTYGKPSGAGIGVEIGNPSGESPSTTLRTPINPTISNNTNQNQSQSQPSAARQSRQRLRSLDTFRG